MKKIAFLIIILFSTISQNIAQNNGSSKSTSKTPAAKAAIEFCACVNDFFKDMHPKLKEFVVRMARDGEKTAEAWFGGEIQKLSMEEQSQIMRDVAKMSNIEPYLEENCSEILKDKYAKYQGNNFKEEIIEHLSKKEDCELTYHFLLVGMQGNESTEDQ